MKQVLNHSSLASNSNINIDFDKIGDRLSVYRAKVLYEVDTAPRIEHFDVDQHHDLSSTIHRMHVLFHSVTCKMHSKCHDVEMFNTRYLPHIIYLVWRQ